MKRWILLVLILWGLSACAPAAPAAQDGLPTLASLPTAETLGQGGGAAGPAVDVTGVDVGQFRFSFSGLYEGVWQGAAVIARLPDDAGYTLIAMSPNAADLGASVTLVLPAPLALGTQPMTGYEGAFDPAAPDRVIGAGGSFTRIVDGALAIYMNVESGSLTVNTVEPLTAALEMTFVEGAERLTLRGVLNAVPFEAGATG